MCDFDVNKVYVKKIRVAKKVHRCCECNIRILSNQKYNYIRGGGEYWREYKTCTDCDALRDYITKKMADENYSECGVELGNMYSQMFDAGFITRVGEEGRKYLRVIDDENLVVVRSSHNTSIRLRA